MSNELTQIDNKILGYVRRQEHYLLRSISWISIGIAILYVCGYSWRSSYYSTLGIPVSIIDFPFPEILIPKPRLIGFMTIAFVVIIAKKYYYFYTEKKRLQRAQKIGISTPIILLHNYTFKKKLNSPDKTNYIVLKEFLTEYISTNSKNNPKWKFERKEFDHQALELFKDIPPELAEDFISYSIRLVFMSKPEFDQTLKDVHGWPPEGSKIYEKMSIPSLVLMVMYVVAGLIFGWGREVIWTVIFLVLGALGGYLLVKLSQVEARWQFWHMIGISVIALFALNEIDGSITVKSELKHNLFPLAKIVQTNGNEQKGLFLGSCSDGYMIMTAIDDNDIYSFKKLHKHSITSISLMSYKQLCNLKKLSDQIENEETKTEKTEGEANVEK